MSKQIFDCLQLLEESLIDLTAAANGFPVPVSRASLERWARRGKRGTRLETILIANRRYTSKEALARFIRNSLRVEPSRSEAKRGSLSKRELAKEAARFGLPEPGKTEHGVGR